MSKNIYKGTCFCREVELTVTGEPVASGFCHCTSCRMWSASPVNAFTLWKPDAVQVTKGASHLGKFSKSPTSVRVWCTKCGGHVLTEHPLWGVTDVYASVLVEFPFRAGVHVNYAEAVVRMKDGLPKQKDMPADMGGSGTLLPD